MANFYSLEPADCRIKIQVCIGYFPDGRMRTRTFGVKNVRPDVSADDAAAVVRAIANLLAFPVVRARLVRKFILNGVKKLGEKLGAKGESEPATARQPAAAPVKKASAAAYLPALLPGVFSGRAGRAPRRVMNAEYAEKRYSF